MYKYIYLYIYIYICIYIYIYIKKKRTEYSKKECSIYGYLIQKSKKFRNSILFS